MRSTPPATDHIQPTLCSDVESLQQLVRTQQQLVRTQQQVIEELSEQLKKSQERIEQLEAEVRSLKKLKGKPKIRASQLNTPKAKSVSEEPVKRAGSAKASKKSSIKIDELDEIE